MPLMSADPMPNHPFAGQLPADAYSQLIRTLRQALPPPLTDSPDDLARRDHAAIARIAALQPANAAEADVAALYVAASEQWKDCLRLVQQPETSACWAMKCRAQANSMMRQAQSALRLLLRMQAARQKTEANREASERAAWTEHCAIGLMAQALPARPEPAAIPEPALETPPEPAPATEHQPGKSADAGQDDSLAPPGAGPSPHVRLLPEPIGLAPPLACPPPGWSPALATLSARRTADGALAERSLRLAYRETRRR